MKFDHRVKYNGKWYAPGVEITEAEQTISVTTSESASENRYTKTDINRMSTADLRILAEKYSLDGDMTGAEIKKILIDKLGL